MSKATLTKHQLELGKQHPTNVRQVNAYIRGIKGVDPELRNGGGYFYFVSLMGYYEHSVYVQSVKQMSYLEWLNEFESMQEQGESR